MRQIYFVYTCVHTCTMNSTYSCIDKLIDITTALRPTDYNTRVLEYSSTMVLVLEYSRTRVLEYSRTRLLEYIRTILTVLLLVELYMYMYDLLYR